MIPSTLQDLRYALRSLRKSPGFTMVALFTLALGIGANSGIFSVINAALLQPLPYPHPDQLVLLFERQVLAIGNRNPVSFANFQDWQNQTHSFESMAAERQNAFNLGGESGRILPERIHGTICSSSLFQTLGISPAVGRAFTADEDTPGAQPVAVISYGLWQARFGGAPDILQRRIRLDSEDYTIVGVMPRTFSYPDRGVGVWVPVQHVLSPETMRSRGAHQFYVLARLRDGVSRQKALAEVDGLTKRMHADHPDELVGRGATLTTLAEEGSHQSRSALLVLFAAVGCLLLIACVNIANLLLARGSDRRREMAIRAALGAGQSRLHRQLLTESILLSAMGAIVGLVLAYGLTQSLSVRAASFLSQGDFDTSQVIRLDPWVFLFTAGVTLLAGIAIGLVPALQIARVDLTTGLKEGGRSATSNRAQRNFRSALVTTEVALSLMLLVAAGLMLRSFAELRRVQPGVRIDHMLTAGLSLPDARYPKREQHAAFFKELLQRLNRLPGVRSAALVSCLPVDGYCGDRVFRIEGRDLPSDQFPFALDRSISPGYFATAGIPLLQGRTLTDEDTVGFDDDHPRFSAVVISESAARQYWPKGDALGQRIHFGGSRAPAYQVVGIVGDVLIGLDDKTRPMMYLPIYEGDRSIFRAIIHTAADPASLASAVRKEISSLDPDIPAFKIRSMAEILDDSAASREFTTFLLGLFAALALLLAAVGLYGVLSYAVAQRSTEIGIRMALGAAQAEVRRLVLSEGMRPAILGVILGVFGSVWATQFLRKLLFGISPNDTATFIAVPLMLIAVALAACLIPAWRATRVDPASALRSE